MDGRRWSTSRFDAPTAWRPGSLRRGRGRSRGSPRPATSRRRGRLGIPAAGTMAHSYIEAFPTEREAFVAFATDFPGRTAFLVDTYDTDGGVLTALDVAAALRLPGPLAVRIDSGDLFELSRRSPRPPRRRGSIRRDDHGQRRPRRVRRRAAVGRRRPDRHLRRRHQRSGSRSDAPTLETVYKLVEYGGRPTMKLSIGKQTMPGPKQVFRPHAGCRRRPCGTIRTGAGRILPDARRSDARRRADTAIGRHLPRAAARLTADLALLRPSARLLRSPTVPTVQVSERLERLTKHTADLHRPRRGS